MLFPDLANARQALRDNPTLSNPQSVRQLLDAVRVQAEAKRTSLVLRVPVGPTGVAVDGKALPNLPPSMVQILGNSHRSGAQPMSGAMIRRQTTPWVFQGSESVRFTVTKNKKVLAQQ